ncbi:MAG: FAD binding domain-containing protein [Candidatus Hydrogenedentes bacterium]|nr:FAD binding domain-containing protein [Candidatus Hydrogenedentota bacterium]
MKSFEYAAPQNLDDAIALLASGEAAFVLAGGTDLVTSMKQGIVSPARLVSLKAIEELKGVDTSGDTVKIGAMTSLAELASNESVAKLYPSIVTAVNKIGSAQIVNMGTVGGDLCQYPRCWYYRNGFGLFGMENGQPLIPDGENKYHAIFGNDGPAKFVCASSLGPALVALGATVTVRGADNQPRDIPATEFFKTPQSPEDPLTAVAVGEVVTHVAIPAKATKNATYEIREREGLDWPLVTATVVYTDNGGKAQDARVVLGHVAPVPWIATGAAAALEGKAVDESSALEAGAAAVEGATPLSKNGFKVQLAKVAVKRAALAAAQA